MTSQCQAQCGTFRIAREMVVNAIRKGLLARRLAVRGRLLWSREPVAFIIISYAIGAVGLRPKLVARGGVAISITIVLLRAGLLP